MRTLLDHAFVLCLSFLLYACAAPVREPVPSDAADATRTIYLVRHGWHAGIVVKRADIPGDVWPQHNEFPDAEYLELGWGDRDYYMTPSPHFGITLKAGLLPTDSVLHVVGFNGAVTRYFPDSEIIRIELSEAGFQQLCGYFESSYALDETGRSIPLGPSLYGDGRFYLSRESYHAFNTCNVWTARGLWEAGCPLSPATNLTVETLMTNVIKFGVVVQGVPSAPEE